jgi:nucleoside-diphosphate-sugar epimerase
VAGRLGEWDERQFNDWEGVAELTGLPDPAFHRNVDKIVLGAGAAHPDAVKVAIVCPPTIYGPGRGPGSGRSRQAYELARLILRRGIVPIVGAGRARWNSVHVHDLSDAFALLADDATAAVARNHSDEVWGPHVYHLAENGEFVWGDLARLMGRKAVELGYLSEAPKEQPLSRAEVLQIADLQAVSWGLNSRGKAIRLRRTLGWNPHRPSIEQEVPAILKSEKARLG